MVKKYIHVTAGEQGIVFLDSVIVTDNSFNIKGIAPYPDMRFLLLDDKQSNIFLIAESGTIKVTIYKDSIYASKVSGTISNESFTEYNKGSINYINNLNIIRNEIIEAQESNDTLLLVDLQQQFSDIRNQLQAYELNFIEQNNNSYVSALILERILMSNIIPVDSIGYYFKNFTKRIQKSKSGQNIGKAIDTEKPDSSIGNVAPNFEGPTPNGNNLSLNNIDGKIILIDFWASWCKTL